MTERHLKDLENALSQSRWIINAKRESDKYSISGYWDVSRPNGDQPFSLTFDGLDPDGLSTLPMNKSYGCSSTNVAVPSLYFARGNSWDTLLAEFMYSLNQLKTC